MQEKYLKDNSYITTEWEWHLQHNNVTFIREYKVIRKATHIAMIAIVVQVVN